MRALAAETLETLPSDHLLLFVPTLLQALVHESTADAPLWMLILRRSAQCEALWRSVYAGLQSRRANLHFFHLFASFLHHTQNMVPESHDRSQCMVRVLTQACRVLAVDPARAVEQLDALNASETMRSGSGAVTLPVLPGAAIVSVVTEKLERPKNSAQGMVQVMLKKTVDSTTVDSTERRANAPGSHLSVTECGVRAGFAFVGREKPMLRPV